MDLFKNSVFANIFAALGVALDRALILAGGFGSGGGERRQLVVFARACFPTAGFRMQFQIDRLATRPLSCAVSGVQTAWDRFRYYYSISRTKTNIEFIMVCWVTQCLLSFIKFSPVCYPAIGIAIRPLTAPANTGLSNSIFSNS